MDASTLSALIDASSKELEKLHEQLGSPQDELEHAMSSLKTCIHDAIRAQVQLVETQVAEVKASSNAYQQRIEKLCKATGATKHSVPSAQPLLATRDALQAEQARLESLYAAQCEQCDHVLNQIHTLNVCMSDAGGAPSEPSSILTNTTDGALRNVTPDTLRRLESHLLHVQQVYKDRKVQMESHLSEILQLWSELHVMPHVAVHAGRVSVHEERRNESQFHMSILQYTRQVPSMELDGQFHGQFEALHTPKLGADESTLDMTPTRVQGAPTLEMDSTAAPELLQPTDAVMEASVRLRESLEREKGERESRIQAYYDELCELWTRFDVPETEMDAFVLDHRGSTLQVVDAYRTELEKMRALKSQHMALFITKTREQLWEQWDALYMSEHERRNMFPAYFLALPQEEEMSTTTPTFDWDELLAEHEQMYAKLGEMLEQRAPILSLIGRYHTICQEARALEESAQDGSRLLGRGNRGDPGRLLREEKMRKRVKVQKPKVEQELLKVLPAWEAEHGMPFMMDGVRFVDHLKEQLGTKENEARPRRAPASKPAEKPTERSNTESLAASRSANGVPATPRVAVKRAGGVPGSRPVPASQARRGGSVARPRIASQSRTAPYGSKPTGGRARGAGEAALSTMTPSTRRLDSSSSAGTVVQRTSDSSHEDGHEDVYEAAQRTPSSYIASSLARSQTPAFH